MSMTGTAAILTTKNKVGLVLAALLGLSDLLSLLVPQGDGQDNGDVAGPPLPVLIAGAVLGVITLVAVVYTWRTANRVGSRIIAGSRILSILGALPAFFVSGVPAFVVALVAVIVVLTIVTIALVLSRPAPEID